MSSVALYEISAMRNVLDAWLEETDGEITPELDELLAEVEGMATEKIERVGLYIRERVSHAKAVKEEVDRLKAIVTREERAAESLKAYLHRQMEALGKPKVEGKLCTVAIQRNSQPAVTCALSDEDLAKQYAEDTAVAQFIREVPVSYRLDRDAVLQAYKAGDAIPADIVVSLGSHVRIR